jgi:hypothetical protein
LRRKRIACLWEKPLKEKKVKIPLLQNEKVDWGNRRRKQGNPSSHLKMIRKSFLFFANEGPKGEKSSQREKTRKEGKRAAGTGEEGLGAGNCSWALFLGRCKILLSVFAAFINNRGKN